MFKMQDVKSVNRIAIVGPPGSGKSFLADILGKRLGLPVYHMDLHFWKPNWGETDEKEWAREVTKQTQKPQWIIEGGYLYDYSTIIPRFKGAELVIFLNINERECIDNVLRRRPQPSDWFPKFLQETEETTKYLIENVIKKYEPKRQMIYKTRDNHAKGKFIELNTREEIDELVNSLL